MQVPRHVTPCSAFAAYAAQQQAFSSGSSASGQGSGQATAPRRRWPTADNGSSNSAMHVCSNERISVRSSPVPVLLDLTLLVVLCAQMVYIECRLTCHSPLPEDRATDASALYRIYLRCNVQQSCFESFRYASPVQASGANQPFSSPSRLQSVGTEGDCAGLEGTGQSARLPRDSWSEAAPRRSSSIPKERPSGSSSTQQAQV